MRDLVEPGRVSMRSHSNDNTPEAVLGHIIGANASRGIRGLPPVWISPRCGSKEERVHQIRIGSALRAQLAINPRGGARPSVIIGVDPHKSRRRTAGGQERLMAAWSALHPEGRLLGEVTPGPHKAYAVAPSRDGSILRARKDPEIGVLTQRGFGLGYAESGTSPFDPAPAVPTFRTSPECPVPVRPPTSGSGRSAR